MHEGRGGMNEGRDGMNEGRDARSGAATPIRTLAAFPPCLPAMPPRYACPPCPFPPCPLPPHPVPPHPVPPRAGRPLRLEENHREQGPIRALGLGLSRGAR